MGCGKGADDDRSGAGLCREARVTFRCARCDHRAEDDDAAAEHARESQHPRCVVCQRRSLTPAEERTCGKCVAAVRADLADIVYGLSILAVSGYPQTSGPTDTGRSDEEPLPGGDALVLESSGGLIWRTNNRRTTGTPTSRGQVDYPEIGDHPAWSRQDEADYGREHKADNWQTDTPSILAELAAWEDDWRTTYRSPAAGKATVHDVVAYLTGNLDTGHRAAQTHDAFDEFARTVHRLATALNRVTRHRPEVAVERRTCIDCGGDLERIIYDLERPIPVRLQAAADRIADDDAVLARKPDAHVPERRDVVLRELTGDKKDGRLQAWECRRCHKPYNREEFWNAVRQRMQSEKEAG